MTPLANSSNVVKNPRAKHGFRGRTCSITSVGSYVPEKILTNADLEKMVDTSDEWITSRTGIRQRRIAASNEFTSHMGAKAALRAAKKGGITPEQIDLIIVATITPDMPFPATAESVAARLHFLRMEGKETFKNAINAMYTAAQESLRRCELDISRIQCIIPHQANQRIIEAVGERLGAKAEQVFVNLDKYGNTSAASVAIALDEAVESGRVQRGDLILLMVFGAGLTWGAAVIEW